MRILLLPFLLQASILFAQEQPPSPPVVSPVPREVTMEGERDGPETIPAGVDAPQEVLHFAEQMPEFPGGQQAMMTYLVKNLKYPQECVESEVEGKVFVGFVVGREGIITDVKVLRGVPGCPALEKEAVPVVFKLT
jgi:outer membrane biosynthesis protein TonB